MFESFKKHTPERLEELLEQYSDSTNLGAIRRVLKRNMYLGDNLELLEYISNTLFGLNDERAEFYTRKCLQLFKERDPPVLWNLPKLTQLTDTDLEKIIPILDEILPSREQYAKKPLNKQERTYVSDLSADSFTKVFIPVVIGKIRRQNAKLEFIENNPYAENSIEVLVAFSNIYHSSHQTKMNLYIEDSNREVSSNINKLLLCDEEELDNYRAELQKKLNKINLLEHKSRNFAKKVINAHPKDYSLLRKLDCIFATTDSNPISLYHQKVEEVLDSPQDVIKIIDFVFKYKNTQYASEHRWALEKLLEKDPNNLEYIKRAAELEFECFERKKHSQDNYNNSRKRAKKFYKKLYELTQDESEIPQEFWRDFKFGRFARSESQTFYQNWNYGGFQGFGNQTYPHPNHNSQKFFSESQRKKQRPTTSSQTKSFDVAFAVLDVEKSSTYETAHNAFKKKALKFHPDRNPGDEKAASKMSALNDAWGDLKKNHYKK